MKMLVLLLAAVLAGCMTQRTWSKSGSGSEDFYTDRGECQSRAYSVVAPAMQQAFVFKGCMEGKGWRLE